MLGIEQVVVILNKMDLIGFEEEKFNRIRRETERFLDVINIRANFYIPISATRGDNVAQKSENMSWYNGPTVLESLDFLKNQPSVKNKPLIFPVQDVYRDDNEKIAVGKIEAGVIKKGQEIKILPGGQKTKVKFIKKFLEECDSGYAGESIGIVTVDSVLLDRGNIICEPNKEPFLVDTFRANVFWLAKKNFNKKEKLTLKCATQEAVCKVEKIEKRINSSTLKVIEKDSDKLKNLEVGEIIIKTKRPIVVKKFNEVQELGRFVFVRAKDICAGGIIV